MTTSHDAPEAPGIAGVTGIYLEGAPRPELQAHFQSVWTSILPDQHTGDIAVVPDGCVDILWRAGRLLVVGPDLVAARPDLEPGAHVLGARFQPGAARHWLGLPLSEIVGQQIELADVWGVRARAFVGRMEEAQAFGKQVAVFQEQLMALPELSGTPDAGASDIFRLAAVATPAAEEGRVAERMCAHLDISKRTLLRYCRDHFGYGPKTLERILRFQRFLSLAGKDHGAGLATLAADTGYADQAHLAREVRALCGMTASALLNQVRH